MTLEISIPGRLRVAALLTIALTLTGCVDTDRSQSGGEAVKECPWQAADDVKGQVSIGWQRIPNGDLIVQDLGLLETCMPNAEITWTPYDSGADVVKAYAGGDLDLALIGNAPTATAISPPNELDVDVVWIHDVIGRAESLIAKDPKVKDLADLAGKTVGVPYGSTAHYSLVQALKDAGVSGVKLINLQPDSMPAAWRSGDVAAVWVWDPTQATLLADGGHRVLSSADTAKAGYPTYDLGTADHEFAEANPDFMTQWATAQNYAVRMLADNPDRAAESIAAVLSQPKADVLTQLEGYTYLDAAAQITDEYLGEGLGDDLGATAGFLLQQAVIEQALPRRAYVGRIDSAPATTATEVNP